MTDPTLAAIAESIAETLEITPLSFTIGSNETRLIKETDFLIYKKKVLDALQSAAAPQPLSNEQLEKILALIKLAINDKDLSDAAFRIGTMPGIIQLLRNTFYKPQPAPQPAGDAELMEDMANALKYLRSGFMTHTGWSGEPPTEIIQADDVLARHNAMKTGVDNV